MILQIFMKIASAVLPEISGCFQLAGQVTCSGLIVILLALFWCMQDVTTVFETLPRDLKSDTELAVECDQCVFKFN